VRLAGESIVLAAIEAKEVVQEEAFRGRDLLDTEDVADYLGVSLVTIWRWCREGSLPCLKIGRQWRIRRSALEDFLERGERSESLTGRLRTFLEIPDNVLAVIQNRELMYRMDAAFFKIGEARGGMLVKYHSGEPELSVDELRENLEREGLEVSSLEEEGRLHLIVETEPAGERVEVLRKLVAEENDEGRSVWINFNWEERVDLETAMSQQEEITRFVEDSSFVVKTTVLEESLDEWPGTDLRRAQILHSATLWLSESGLALSRVVPPT
jgi:excisionase family DNA binding protein